jgi:hypothetical protein
MPTLHSGGIGFAYNLPVRPHPKAKPPPAGSKGLHSANLEWGVRINVPQAQVGKPSDEVSIWERMFRPSGWFYGNSAGDAQSGIVGFGGGHASGYLKFKRGSERCRVDYEMAGAGIGLPGGGWSHSSEAFASWGFQVYCTSRITGQMKAADFAGTMLVLDFAFGGSAGASGADDSYLILFCDKVESSMVVPNPLNWKAGLVYGGMSGGAGTPGATLQLVGYSGVSTLHTDGNPQPRR